MIEQIIENRNRKHNGYPPGLFLWLFLCFLYLEINGSGHISQKFILYKK